MDQVPGLPAGLVPGLPAGLVPGLPAGLVPGLPAGRPLPACPATPRLSGRPSLVRPSLACPAAQFVINRLVLR